MFFSIILSLKIIIFSIPLLILFALIITFLKMKSNFIINRFIDILINLPLIFPPVGTGFALIYIFSKRGLLGGNFDILFSFQGLCIAAFISGIPFITRAVNSGLKKDIEKLCEASYCLGKSEFETFLFVVIPNLKKNFVHGLSLSIGRIIGEVGISLMIGGNIAGKTNTISLEIYNAVLEGEEEKALILSLILFLFSIFIFSIISLFDIEK